MKNSSFVLAALALLLATVSTTYSQQGRQAVSYTHLQDQVDFTDDHEQLGKKLAVLTPRGVTAGDATGTTGCPAMNFYQADLIVDHNDPLALAVATADVLTCAFGNDTRMSNAAQSLATSTAYSMVSASNVLMDYSFRRLQEIIRRISVLPGQRSIVLVSPGFLFNGREVDAVSYTHLRWAGSLLYMRDSSSRTCSDGSPHFRLRFGGAKAGFTDTPRT